MRTDYKHLLVERAEGVVTITMNRPEVLNSFNDIMLDELIEVMGRATMKVGLRLSAQRIAGPAHIQRNAGSWGGMGERKAHCV